MRTHRLSPGIRLLIVTVATLTAATASVLAGPPAYDIPVPNGDFERVYKPGSTTVEALLTGWTDSVGLNVPLNGGHIVTYADTSTGYHVDIPGWVGTGAIDGGGVVQDTGKYGYAANGGRWGSPHGERIESAAALTTILPDTSYMLAARIGSPNGGGGIAGPILFELFTETGPLTPSASTWPTLEAPYPYQTVELTFDAADLTDHLGESLRIRLGSGDPSAGTQVDFDNVSLSAVTIPEPATLAVLALGAAGLLARRRR